SFASSSSGVVSTCGCSGGSGVCVVSRPDGAVSGFLDVFFFSGFTAAFSGRVSGFSAIFAGGAGFADSADFGVSAGGVGVAFGFSGFSGAFSPAVVGFGFAAAFFGVGDGEGCGVGLGLR